MVRLSGGQAVARALRAEGIDTVFGIVGTHNVHIFDGLLDVPDIQVVTVRHEQGAGFMADGYARATGRPAACVVVPGPGVTNLMTALGQAYLDSTPILAIAGQNPTRLLDRRLEEFHELHDSLGVVRSVTAGADRITGAAEAPAKVRAAARLMRTRRPQPTFLELPLDVAAEAQDVELLAPVEDFMRPTGSPEAIGHAARLLSVARRPLILAGGGAIAAQAGRAVKAVAERLGAPVVTTVHGKGIVPDDDPFALGDGWGRLDLFADLFAEADATLVVGASFEYVSDYNRGKQLPDPLIHVDLDPTVINRHRPATVGIVGDARLVLERLLDALGEANGAGAIRPWCDAAAVRARKRRAIEVRAGPVVGLLDQVRAAIPRDAIVADDLCLPGYWAPPAFDVYEPRTFFHPGMYGTLGYALPAAIGAQIGRPDRPSVALCGDGGFLYTAQELSTAVQQRVKVVAIVFNDNAYGTLRLFQDRHLRGRRIGIELRNPDFARFAESFGARGVKLRASSELGAALADAIVQEGPTVIECPLDFPLDGVLPPWMT
ncbi:MAG: thiamine pyrophosphate-binding protein [Chloroflexota bacterium]|nr:thiamine pyrophosphate-binding protein [Chloroflexota bacterium]